MSDPQPAGFGQFVPGFDFLQNLARGATQGMAQMPGMAQWIVPSLNVEELQKRIDELKAVQFWLEQNARALTAVVQALEVQKMTLSALKAMNLSAGDMAEAFKVKMDQAAGGAAIEDLPPAADKPAAPAGSGLVDPLQLWGSLAQQFQQIAAGAMAQAAPAAADERESQVPQAAGAIRKPAASRTEARKSRRVTPQRKL